MKKDYPLSVVYILLLFTMLFWASAFVWVNQVLEIGFKPITIAFLRMVVATVFLTLCTKILRIKEKIRKEDHKLIFFLAFAEPFCYFLGLKFGMQFLTPTTASIMISTIPLFLPIFAWLILKESVSINKTIGLLVSFVGVMLIVIEDLNFGGRLIGFLLLSISVLSGTAYSILLRKLTNKYSALTITKYQASIAMWLYLPLFFIFDFREFVSMSLSMPLTLLDFRFIVLLGALPSSLSFVFYTIAVRKLGVVRPSIMTNIIPVFTAILAFYILKEPFTTVKIIAMGVVIAGLFVSQVDRKNVMRKE